MALKVMKFGGSSVADADKIRTVANRIARDYDAGHSLIVVVSAMGKTTDRLVAMAQEISNGNPSEREYDMLLATGEQISIAMVAMALQAQGRPALSLTGQQVGIITDTVHSKARIREIRTNKLLAEIEKRNIAIVAGFQGMTHDEDITTLGRGGSDLTAVALAAAVKADVCEIYSDVNGVFTTDPRVVPQARKLDYITFDEMLELATAGAKVLHNRAVECAKNYNVRLHARSTFEEADGTFVVREYPQMEDTVISGVAFRRAEAKITILGVPDQPGIAAKVFGALAGAQIVIDMIIQNESRQGRNDIGFTVDRVELGKALKVCEKLKAELNADALKTDEHVAKVSVVGVGIQTHVDVAARMFQALAAANINIHSISTSEIKISVLIDEDKVDQAVQLLHESFELAGAK